jgi:hypothetical protein
MNKLSFAVSLGWMILCFVYGVALPVFSPVHVLHPEWMFPTRVCPIGIPRREIMACLMDAVPRVIIKAILLAISARWTHGLPSAR